ncbi:unnamed protein product [Lactuca saligna]|uniref:Uncharacterized protein n=1 Tax=Lactuca saligna TaxID=75948 RepID=A0AA36E8Z6_LACSI|nr:unnamed protein product [Lactuca saligna]
MLIPKYYEQWVDRMEDYLNEIDEDLWRCITSGNYRPRKLEQVTTVGSSTDDKLQAERQEASDKKCLYELRGALPPVVYNYINYSGMELTPTRIVVAEDGEGREEDIEVLTEPSSGSSPC